MLRSAFKSCLGLQQDALEKAAAAQNEAMTAEEKQAARNQLFEPKAAYAMISGELKKVSSPLYLLALSTGAGAMLSITSFFVACIIEVSSKLRR